RLLPRRALPLPPPARILCSALCTDDALLQASPLLPELTGRARRSPTSAPRRLRGRRAAPEPARMRLRRPERERGREQESGGRREHGDANRANRRLGLLRTRPAAWTIGPPIRTGDPEPQNRWTDVDALAHLEL